MSQSRQKTPSTRHTETARYFDTALGVQCGQRFCNETQSKNACTVHWAHRSFCTTRRLEGARALSPQSTVSSDGRLMTILYTIFTQSLHHFYDLPRLICHTLQRHDGAFGLTGLIRLVFVRRARDV